MSLKEAIAQEALAAARAASALTDEGVSRALLAAGALVRARRDEILSANRLDVDGASGTLDEGTLDRLRLDETRVETLAGRGEVATGPLISSLVRSCHRGPSLIPRSHQRAMSSSRRPSGGARADDLLERLEDLVAGNSHEVLRRVDYEVAVILPEARELLARFDERSAHYETVLGPGARRTANPTLQGGSGVLR